MKEYVSVKGISIAYQRIVPENPVSDVPVVFLHDSLGSISVWKDFPNQVVSQLNRVGILYDRQGYGSSAPFDSKNRDNSYLEIQADFLIELLDNLGIDKCIVFGHSDGGSISLIAGGKHPHRIAGIITEGAHVFVEEITLSGIREAREAYKNTDLKNKLAKHHGDKVQELFDAWTETWLTPEFSKWSIEHFLPKITCPVLTIYGDKDEYGSLRQPDTIYSKVCGISEKTILPEIGHTPHREAKDETLKVTANFIERYL